jgi:hypothetical protein
MVLVAAIVFEQRAQASLTIRQTALNPPRRLACTPQRSAQPSVEGRWAALGRLEAEL